MKSTFNILTFLLALVANAQQVGVKEPKQGFHDVKIGVNLFRSATTFLGSGKDSHEAQIALGINRMNVVMDVGIENNNRSAAYSYENKGNYFRVGIDNNFVKHVQSGNVLALGLRYARASFNDELIYTLDNGFGEQNLSLSNPDLNARWVELVFTLRGKIVSQLYTGFSLRWKFSRKINGEGILRTYDIPGFGTTSRENATSFDYYLMWRIPTKKPGK